MRVPRFDSQVSRATTAMAAGHLSTGPDIDEAESRLKSLTGRRHAILVSNGFSALYASLRCLAETETAVTTVAASTCTATTSAISACGKRIRFVDLEDTSMGTPREMPADVAQVVVAVDHFGYISPLNATNNQQSLLVIQDAAQSFFSCLRPFRPQSVATIFSFYPTKVINGIDGGAILVDSDSLAEKIRAFCNYQTVPAGHTQISMNFRMPNLHAAFLLGTLDHLDEIRKALSVVFERLSDVANRKGLRVRLTHPHSTPIRFVVEAESEVHRDELINRLSDLGIGASRELILLCDPSSEFDFPVASRLTRTTLSLPFYPQLTEEELHHMECALGQF